MYVNFFAIAYNFSYSPRVHALLVLIFFICIFQTFSLPFTFLRVTPLLVLSFILFLSLPTPWFLLHQDSPLLSDLFPLHVFFLFHQPVLNKLFSLYPFCFFLFSCFPSVSFFFFSIQLPLSVFLFF